MESILTDVKDALEGIQEEVEDFDRQLKIHINSLFPLLGRIGVKPDIFKIEDETTTWSEYVQDDYLIALIKEYVILKCRLLFDPPASSVVLESYKALISEYEFSINEYVETNNQ